MGAAAVFFKGLERFIMSLLVYGWMMGEEGRKKRTLTKRTKLCSVGVPPTKPKWLLLVPALIGCQLVTINK